MPRVAQPVLLTDDERLLLKKLAARSPNWHERQRAQTVLLLSENRRVMDVAALQEISTDSVRRQRDAWLKRGFEGLRDLPRCGAPRQLTQEDTQAVCAWSREAAYSSTELQARLAAERKVRVSAWVVRSALFKNGFLWKRTRHSLKKSATKSVSAPHSETSPA